MMVFSLAVMPSCSKDDEPTDPNKPSNVDPVTPTGDPVGTVTMRMRNDNATKLNGIKLSSDNNFFCEYGMIASLGPVTGLGNVTDIPLTGWTDQIAVTIGNGYVYYDGNNYYRIYAVQWLQEAVTTEVIGVELKYQTPFKGVDEEIQLENSTISISGKGTESQDGEVVFFTNTSIIPFTVTSDQDWCSVRRCSSYDDPDFLYNGVAVFVTPSDSQEESRAKIEIKTLYGKRTILTVVRGAETPQIFFPNGESKYVLDDIVAAGSQQTLRLTSNLEAENITFASSADWLTAEIVSSKSAPQKTVRRVEGLNDDEVRRVQSRATSTISMTYTIAPNFTSARREANLTISSKKGEKVAEMSVSQVGGAITVSRQEDFEVAAKAQELSFTFNSSVPGEYTVTSDKAWCTVAKESYDVTTVGYNTVRLSLSDNISESKREATISISSVSGSLKEQIKVVQEGLNTSGMPTAVYFDKNAGYQTVDLPVSGLTVTSKVDWCSVSIKDNKLTVRVADTSADRTTKLTISGLSITITVDQSKYAVNDTYSEGNITGTVCYMEGAKRLVRSDLLGQAEYSIENVEIGTDSTDDGIANMSVIKRIAGWEKFYPAFALCNALNVDGVSGWYLPARDEMVGWACWTSTESSSSSAYYQSSGSSNKTSVKSASKSVYAVHHFVEAAAKSE